MIVYESKSSSNNFKKNIKEILKNIKNDYYIGYRLARKDIKSNYSKSYLGVFWDFLEPIALSVVFIFLHKSKFLNTEDLTMSYSIFVIFGLLMWQIFNDTLTKSMEIVNSSKTLLSQLNVSTEALIMSVIYRMMFNSIFVISSLLIFSFIMSEASLGGMIVFVMLFPIIILLGLSIGLFLAPFNTINSDIGSFTKIALRALFFTSAVLFPIPKEGILHTFGVYNPLVYIFENMRYVAIGHQINWIGFLSVVCGVFALLMIAWYIFHISIKVLAERL